MGHTGDCRTAVQRLAGHDQLHSFLPLPHNPLVETPVGFGSPISMHAMHTFARPTWLVAEIADISMGANPAVGYATLGDRVYWAVGSVVSLFFDCPPPGYAARWSSFTLQIMGAKAIK